MYLEGLDVDRVDVVDSQTERYDQQQGPPVRTRLGLRMRTHRGSVPVRVQTGLLWCFSRGEGFPPATGSGPQSAPSACLATLLLWRGHGKKTLVSFWHPIQNSQMVRVQQVRGRKTYWCPRSPPCCPLTHTQQENSSHQIVQVSWGEITGFLFVAQTYLNLKSWSHWVHWLLIFSMFRNQYSEMNWSVVKHAHKILTWVLVQLCLGHTTLPQTSLHRLPSELQAGKRQTKFTAKV